MGETQGVGGGGGITSYTCLTKNHQIVIVGTSEICQTKNVWNPFDQRKYMKVYQFLN